MKAVLTFLNMAFLPISRSRFKQRWILMLILATTVKRFCVNFGVIFGHIWKVIFFSKDRLNWGKYEMLKFWWISKIEFWSEELVDGHQRGVLSLAGGGGVNCLVVFPTHFNPNNSILYYLINFAPIHVYPRLNFTTEAPFILAARLIDTPKFHESFRLVSIFFLHRPFECNCAVSCTGL